MPAPYVVRRRITNTAAAGAPQLVDLRTEEWSGRSPRLKAGAPGYADQDDALLRAAIIQVFISVESGVVRVMEALGQPGYVGSATPTVIFENNYRVEDNASRFWYHTDGAEAVFEVEISFDVPFVPETF